MKKSTRAASLLGTLALLGSLTVAVAPAANAVPLCGNVSVDLTGASVSCFGSGAFRLGFTCYAAWPWETTWTKYGPWVNAPLSTAFSIGSTCDSWHSRRGFVQL